MDPGRRLITGVPGPPSTAFSKDNMANFGNCPVLGAGIGLRKEHFRALQSVSPAEIGWLEIIPENFMNFGGFPQAVLDFCSGRWPIVSHGVNLSIGSVD